MTISYLKILAIANYLFFIVYMLFGKSGTNVSYIKYILYSFPLLGIKIIGELGGFEIITITFFFIFYKFKRNVKYINNFYFFLILILISDITIGFFNGTSFPDVSTIAEFMGVFIHLFFCKILIEECMANQTLFKIVTHILITMLWVSAIFLLAQIILGPSISLSAIQNPNIVSSEGIRYPSFMSDPQVYSQYLSIMSFVCLMKMKEVNTKNRYILLFIFCIIGIMLAGGRAAFLGFFAGMIIVFVFSKFQMKIWMLCISMLILGLSIFFKEKLMIFKRGTNIHEAYEVRNAIWHDAYDIFKHYPFFGIGINNYSNYVSIQYPDQIWFRENEYITFDHPESGYLKILTEYGLIGFVCVFLLILIPIFKGIQKFKQDKNFQYILLIAAIVSWLIGFYSTFSVGDTRFKIIISSIICLLIIIECKKREHIILDMHV